MAKVPCSSSWSLTAVFFSGMLGYKDGAVGAAIVAVVLVHVIIAGFVYAAWAEGLTPTKKD